MIKPRAIRRVCSRLVGWLAAGLVITVAVSWGLAAWMPQVGWRATRFTSWGDQASVHVTQWESLGCARRQWWSAYGLERVLPSYYEPIKKTPQALSPSDATDPVSWPPWGDFLQARHRLLYEITEGLSVEWEGCEHCTGWPLPAAWYSIRDMGRQRFEPVGAIPLPIVKTASGMMDVYSVRGLPYRPIWPGLAINSVFWGAIAFGVVNAYGRTRRTLRRRRGLCPACAYPVGASPVCTECGAAVTTSSQPA